MRHRLLFSVLALSAPLAACLPEGRQVEGRQLFTGRSVEKPGFVSIDKVPYVLFQERTSPATPPRSAVYNLWIVKYDTGEKQLLLANIADRDSWRPLVDAKGVRYIMADEHFVDGTSPVGVPSPAGTLVRLDLSKGVLERIPEVSTFSVTASGQFFYRTVTPGSHLPELHLRTVAGNDRSLGPSAGAAQIVAPDRLYFVAGDDRVLSRIASADAPVESIQAKVSRFLLSSDEKWVVMQTVADGKPQTVALQLATPLPASTVEVAPPDSVEPRRLAAAPAPPRKRILPGVNPCCWLGFSGTEFVYSDSAAAGSPGKLHAFDVVKGTDRVVSLPQGLSDVSSIIGRPMSNDSLYVDSRGRMAVVPNEDPSAGRVLDIRPVSPAFSDDGRYLVYVDPDPDQMGEGRLMVQDGEFAQPPRLLSPPGSLVPPGGYFFIPDGERRILVFWAHFGRNASDLYFANHETGESRIVAEGISEVTVTPRRVFGIVRVSEQDLVGELVNKDLIMNEETVLAHSVSDASVWGTRVAFVIRERIATVSDGLWAIPSDGVTGMTISGN
jgi:hypothetical protein